MGWHTDFTPTTATITSRPGAIMRAAAWAFVAFVVFEAHVALWQLASQPFEGAWIVGALLVLIFAGIAVGGASVALRSTVLTFERPTRLVTSRRLWGRRVRAEQRYPLGAYTDVALETSRGHRGVTSYHLVLRGDPQVVLLSGGRDITRLVDEVRAWLARGQRNEGGKGRQRRSRKRR